MQNRYMQERVSEKSHKSNNSIEPNYHRAEELYRDVLRSSRTAELIAEYERGVMKTPSNKEHYRERALQLGEEAREQLNTDFLTTLQYLYNEASKPMSHERALEFKVALVRSLEDIDTNTVGAMLLLNNAEPPTETDTFVRERVRQDFIRDTDVVTPIILGVSQDDVEMSFEPIHSAEAACKKAFAVVSEYYPEILREGSPGRDLWRSEVASRVERLVAISEVYSKVGEAETKFREEGRAKLEKRRYMNREDIVEWPETPAQRSSVRN